MIDLPHCAADFEEAVAIDHRFDDRSHFVDLARIARHDVEQELLAPLRVVVGGDDRRQLVDVRRQIRQKARGPLERFGFTRDFVVDRAVARVDAARAEFFLRHVAELRPVHQRGTGDHHLRGVLHDQRVVRRRHARGADAGDRSQCERHRRRYRQVRDDRFPTGDLRDVRAARGLDRLHRTAAAHAVHETDVRQSQFQCETFGALPFAGDRRIGRTAAHGEVVAGENHRTAADVGGAEHEVRRRERAQLAVRVVAADAGQRADFVERAGIADRGDAFANRQLAEFVLPRDFVCAAHLQRHRFAAAQLVDLFVPTHRYAAARTIQHAAPSATPDFVRLACSGSRTAATMRDRVDWIHARQRAAQGANLADHLQRGVDAVAEHERCRQRDRPSPI